MLLRVSSGMNARPTLSPLRETERKLAVLRGTNWHVAETTCNCCTYKCSFVGLLGIAGLRFLVFLVLCAPECSSGAVSGERKSKQFFKCPSTTNRGTFQIISAVLCAESKNTERAGTDVLLQKILGLNAPEMRTTIVPLKPVEKLVHSLKLRLKY